MNLDDCEKIFSNTLASKTESEFAFEINPIWDKYEILSLGFGRGSIYWRARLVEDEIYTNIDELKYPSKEKAKLGRLNEIGKPCFYAATTRETALAEVDAQEDQLIQMAGYRVPLESCLQLALVGEYSNVQKTGYISMTGSDPDRTISKLLNEKSLSEGIRCVYIDRFLSEILADVDAKNDNYLKSRTLAELIYSKVDADGIAFPSVKDKGGFNIAVKPDSYEKNLHNVACLIVKVKRKRKYGILEYEVVKSAQTIDDNGDFVWMPKDSPYEMGIYGMTKHEYEFAMKSPHDKNNLMNVTSFYSRNG